ncbi:MAG TPA: hypothetical protein VFS91_11300, partial [Nitrobacter sp.]|nr:hypothetical protein [Nitrobacter sp.]
MSLQKTLKLLQIPAFCFAQQARRNNSSADETTFGRPRRHRETGAGSINPPNQPGHQAQTARLNDQGTVMIKALSAVAVAAFIAAALTVLPGF